MSYRGKVWLILLLAMTAIHGGAIYLVGFQVWLLIVILTGAAVTIAVTVDRLMCRC